MKRPLYALFTGLCFLVAVYAWVMDSTSLLTLFLAFAVMFIVLGSIPQGSQSIEPVELFPDDEREVRRSLAKGRKIEAVRLVRQLSGASLVAAKNYVDSLEKK